MKEIRKSEMMIEEATRFNTTVENLEESGFFFCSDACGDCHWFAFINGTMMSLAWFRERQRKLREEYINNRKLRTRQHFGG